MVKLNYFTSNTSAKIRAFKLKKIEKSFVMSLFLPGIFFYLTRASLNTASKHNSFFIIREFSAVEE